MRHPKTLWMSVALALSAGLNLCLLFVKEQQAAYEVSGECPPQHIISRYQMIQRNNDILACYGCGPEAFTARFLTSSEIPDSIGFYCMTKLNRGPKAHEPMVYQSKEDSAWSFAVQRSGEQSEIAIPVLDAQKQVYEVNWLRDSPSGP